MLTKDQIHELIGRSEWTDAESQAVLDYLESGQTSEWTDLLRSRFKQARDITTPVNKDRAAQLLDAIHEKMGTPVRQLPGRRSWGWVAAAAVLLLAGSVSYLFYTGKQKENNSDVAAPVAQHDIQPGGNKAVLILADGSAITLDSTANGELASQGKVTIIKTGEGQLQYQGQDDRGTWNTLRTPRGGQYEVILPDGTKVWLNAASSITYPTSFTGNERTVEMSGEAYFEVVHNDKMPFRVKARGLIVRDLGTAFNVNTYPDEASSKVTLLEGSAEVTAGGRSKLLAPGEQVIVKEEKITGVGKVETEEAIAWKKGYFHFRQTDLPAMIRQLQRWYNIDVQYTGAVPVRSFSGKITRDLTLSQVITILADMEVRFRIEGNTLVVGH